MSRNTTSGFGIPFHEFDGDGALIRSFGAPPNEKIVSRDQLPLYRVGAFTHTDGSFWSIEARVPRLRHWGADGQRVSEWTLPFRGFAPLTSTMEGAPPGAEFSVIEQTSDGVLLVAMAYRGRDYQRAYAEESTVDGRRIRSVEDIGSYFDTRIFVFDPRTRKLLVYVDIDPFLLGSLGAGRFWGVASGGANGEVVVVQLTLTR